MRIELAYSITFADAVKAMSASPFTSSGEISHITTNSKECKPGDLFFAIAGENHSEEAFINEAISLGAIPVTSITGYNGIHVKDTKEALLGLSEFYLSRLPKLKERICITGSVGKTTTKEFLLSILKDTYITHATIKNYNNDIGVPLTIFTAPKNCEILILELGMNHRGEIKRLSEHVHPTLSIITNIGTSHIGNLGSKETIAKEKSDILSGMSKPMLICEYGESLLEHIDSKRTVSCECSFADFFLLPVKEDITGTTFDFYSTDLILSNVRFNVAGRHMLYLLSIAISAAVIVKVPLQNIEQAINSIGDKEIRHKIIKLRDFYILDDSYNASRESVFADIRLLSFYKSHTCSALLGDILELGNFTESIHREIGGFAYRSGIEKLYLFGVYSHFTMQGAMDAGMSPSKIFINTDTEKPEATATVIKENHIPGEIILFKASNKMKLGRIIDILTSQIGDKNA